MTKSCTMLDSKCWEALQNGNIKESHRKIELTKNISVLMPANIFFAILDEISSEERFILRYKDITIFMETNKFTQSPQLQPLPLCVELQDFKAKDWIVV